MQYWRRETHPRARPLRDRRNRCRPDRLGTRTKGLRAWFHEFWHRKAEQQSRREHGHTTESEAHLTKVSIRLDGSDGYEFETMWAEPITDRLYVLRNIPFLAYGYSEQDVVSAADVEGRLVVNGVFNRGGHSTYRVFLREPASEEQFCPLWQSLAALGCTFERANRRLIGLDVPRVRGLRRPRKGRGIRGRGIRRGPLWASPPRLDGRGTRTTLRLWRTPNEPRWGR